MGLEDERSSAFCFFSFFYIIIIKKGKKSEKWARTIFRHYRRERKTDKSAIMRTET